VCSSLLTSGWDLHLRPMELVNCDEDATTEGQRTLYGFGAVYVFDVAQTEGKELPALTEVNGNVSVRGNHYYRKRERRRVYVQLHVFARQGCDC